MIEALAGTAVGLAITALFAAGGLWVRVARAEKDIDATQAKFEKDMRLLDESLRRDIDKKASVEKMEEIARHLERIENMLERLLSRRHSDTNPGV